jgi:DTW domain-containing protein YfiP
LPRALCEGCSRPLVVCICAQLVSMQTRTNVVVLQHPRESDNAIGTAWLVERCLGARRIVGLELEEDPAFRAALADPDAPAVLLSPGPTAVDLAERPPEGRVTLVVLDGTWSQARTLLRANPSLASLPRYSLRPASPSNYRIRREPAEHCVSTIEATVAALSILEPRCGGEPLDPPRALAAFDAMVDHQIRMGARRDSRHRRAALARRAKANDKPPRRRPLAGVDLVVAYAEANAWPRGTELGAFPELAHVVAERLATGERFEAFVAPERPLSPAFSFHTDVPAERVLDGEGRASFEARFRAFFRDGDVLGVWGSYAMRMLRDVVGAAIPAVDLRITASEFLGRSAGEVSAAAVAFGCVIEPPWAIGRTGVRQAAATGIARVLADEAARGSRAVARVLHF